MERHPDLPATRRVLGTGRVEGWPPVALAAVLALAVLAGPVWADPPWMADIEDLQLRVGELEVLTASLHERITELEQSSEPLTLDVDCGAGDTVADALDLAAGRTGPVTIRIQGVCHENVLISRSDITLEAAGPGDGFGATGAPGRLVEVVGAHGVHFGQLTFSLGVDEVGIRASDGAQVSAVGLVMANGANGIEVLEGCVGLVDSSDIRNMSSHGILARGAHLILRASAVEDNLLGVSVSGGTLHVVGGSITGQGLWGVSVLEQASATLIGTHVDDNLVGLFLTGGATASLGSGARLHNNTAEGARVWEDSILFLGTGALVEDSGSHGVAVRGGSLVVPIQSTIRNNGGSGIYLTDTSLAGSRGSGNDPEISGNSGWGVFCEPAPAVAQIQQPGYAAASVFNNGAGQMSCPGFMFP